MPDEITLETIINTVNSRYECAKQDGYNNYAEYIWDECTIKNPDEIFKIIDNELQNICVKNESESFFNVDKVLSDIFTTIRNYFGFSVFFNDKKKYAVLNGLQSLGTFDIVLDNPPEFGSWFEIVDDSKGIVNMSVTNGELTQSECILLWHEIGHAIHHLTNDLETIPPNEWELGGILFEELCREQYNIGRTEHQLKKDVAISLIDLELSLCTGITEEEIIKMVEHIQNYVGVDISFDDFGTITEGQYGAVYWTYPYCRYLVRNDLSLCIKKVGELSTQFLFEFQTLNPPPHIKSL